MADEIIEPPLKLVCTNSRNAQEPFSKTPSYTSAPMHKDTTSTKIFVGGLAYHTTDETLKHYFQVFGEIEEAVVITDRQTGKSRGYGFVTMSTPEDAFLAVRDPNPCIDGRKANVNLAILGAKPRSIPAAQIQAAALARLQQERLLSTLNDRGSSSSSLFTASGLEGLYVPVNANSIPMMDSNSTTANAALLQSALLGSSLTAPIPKPIQNPGFLKMNDNILASLTQQFNSPSNGMYFNIPTCNYINQNTSGTGGTSSGIHSINNDTQNLLNTLLQASNTILPTTIAIPNTMNSLKNDNERYSFK